MCPRKAWARTPPGRNWLSQGPRLTNGAVSSIGRIAQDAEGVGQRPDARYVVDGGMTARWFATRSSPSSDGGKGQALMFPSGATAAVTCATGLPIGSASETPVAEDLVTYYLRQVEIAGCANGT